MSTVTEVKGRFKIPQSPGQLATNMREVFQAAPQNKRKVPEALPLVAYKGTGKTRLSIKTERDNT